MLVKAGEERGTAHPACVRPETGDGWAVAFKMESHHHPGAIKPFQGAATGVGGIIRDIFTMGARPVFSLNFLRFENITETRNAEGGTRKEDVTRGASDLSTLNAQLSTNHRLFAGVVSGIAHCGNCLGVPTLGGEGQVFFLGKMRGCRAGRRWSWNDITPGSRPPFHAPRSRCRK